MTIGRVNQLSVSNFRSLKKLNLPLDYLAVYLGENGTGKTNIYRALELCHHAAKGDVSRWLARQGGMSSTMWAGELKTHEEPTINVTVKIGNYRYTIQLGFRSNTMAAFDEEPLIKHEFLEYIAGTRKYTVMERRGPSVTISKPDSTKQVLDFQLLLTETALSTIPAEMASEEVAVFRNTLLDWRFFHSFRVDEDAPIRRECDAVTATKLDPDGTNLAAVFATLEWIREDTVDLKEIVSEAFGGANLVIPYPSDKAGFSMVYKEIPKRQFSQREVSDGTIQFLALCGALLSYHTPHLMVLNEPEASLHEEMMPALAKLISKANEAAQIVVVTHSQRLTTELEQLCACPIRTVCKQNGATKIQNLTQFGEYEE